MSTRQGEPEWLDENSPGTVLRGGLKKYKDNELCGIAQDRSALMTRESGMGEGSKVALSWNQGELTE